MSEVDYVIFGERVQAEDAVARPTDYGVGRRCAECGAKVSRYTEPVPGLDEVRCNLHWRMPDTHGITMRGDKLVVIQNACLAEADKKLAKQREREERQAVAA